MLLFSNLLAAAFAVFLFSGSRTLAAEKAAPLSAMGRMPIKELTVFKDGHAFVDRQGTVATDSNGDVLIDELPNAVLGTFWPYSSDKHARLTGTVASRHRVMVEHTALSLRELFEGNIGADCLVTEDATNRYQATILAVPQRSAEELAATAIPGSSEQLPQKGTIILLKTAAGTRVVNIDRLQDVTFLHDHKSAASDEEFRNLLTMKLEWEKGKKSSSANVGLIYLQRGVRWIPSYKVSLDSKGQAALKLEATLINELGDFEDANVNLVVGVPTFQFKDTLDPMALQETAAQLSQFFQNDQNGRFANNGLAQNFSNAIMTQQRARMGEFRAGGGGAAEPESPTDLGPEVGDSQKAEDLFVYGLKHITLRKGERMVVQVAEFTIPYQDVFTLELPVAPPPEARGQINSEQQRELARLIAAPKVMHKIRLANKSAYPLTTAPAMILREDRILAQGLMTYAAAGSQSDLPVTTAVDIQAKRSDIETRRVPNAATYNHEQYARLELAGKVTLSNHRTQAADVEVTRFVFGTVESAAQEGKFEKLSPFEDGDSGYGSALPQWWNWYELPYGWSALNGISRVKWNVHLEPGASTELAYNWFYFWR